MNKENVMFKILLFGLFISLSTFQVTAQVSNRSLLKLIEEEKTAFHNGDLRLSFTIRSDIFLYHMDDIPNDEKSYWVAKLAEGFLLLKEDKLALGYLQKALSYNDPDTYNVNTLMAGAFINLEKYNNAKSIYLSEIQNANASCQMISLYNALGYCNYKTSDYETARFWYNKGLETFASNGSKNDSIQYYIIKSNLVSLDLSQGRSYQAKVGLDEITNWIQLENNKEFHDEIRVKRIRFFIHEGTYKKAKEYISEFNTSKLSLLELKEFRSIFFDFGTKEEINEIVNLFIRKQEEVLLDERLNNEATISFFYKRQELNKRSLLLKNKERLRLSNSNEKKVILLFVFLVAGVFISIVWLKKIRRVNKNDKKNIEDSNTILKKELEIEVLLAKVENERIGKEKLEISNLLGKVKLNSDLFLEIKKKLAMINPEESDAQIKINVLSNFINEQLAKSENMLSRINEPSLSSVSFKNTILKVYPNLSKLEVQMLVLIKMEMSNKEMAQIKNVEASSIRVLKNRLKKKIDCPADISLESFVQSIEV